MRLLTWNLEFAPPGGRRGTAIEAVIAHHDPDVVCLTETHATWSEAGGHWIWADADYGYPLKGDRRKVGLWSRWPWTDVDELGHPGLPAGRFVAGTTDTELGPIRVIGVCIPWQMAHVSTGRGDRSPWQDHTAYLDVLALVLAAADGPTVVMGDFNQRIPRVRTPALVHDALLAAFAPLTIVTAGAVDGLDDALIDHVAVTDGMTPSAVTGISRFADGLRLSDHDGVAVNLSLS